MIESTDRHGCSLLTNHGHVLVCIAERPGIRTRQIPTEAGIAERAAQRNIGEREAAGHLSHPRGGRRIRYEDNPRRNSDHPLERHLDVGTRSLDPVRPTHAGGPK